MRFNVGDRVVIRNDITPGQGSNIIFANGIERYVWVTGCETWFQPGQIITIDGRSSNSYVYRGEAGLLDSFIDFTATAALHSSLNTSGRRNFTANHYVVITKNNLRVTSFNSNYIYQVRRDHYYLQVYKDNIGIQNGVPTINLEDTRPASEAEVIAYKTNGGPCCASEVDIGISLKRIKKGFVPLNHYVPGQRSENERYMCSADRVVENVDFIINNNKKLHQKAQVLKKRAKTKIKLIIK